ncbi:hypothetical protein [Sphingobium subterraneum]|uniref:Uncharacterized protein n=1 Tax=Sphingobium subterraneum TaxID=627688 RepID=A0A841J157_9SPHN|nr:hypothetical protein [Sphingobium subterraneum]MBB6123256.1 hypothetical protein [Sphingobium subterraneum]
MNREYHMDRDGAEEVTASGAPFAVDGDNPPANGAAAAFLADQRSRRRRSRRPDPTRRIAIERRGVIWVLCVWVTLAFLFFLWQAINYRGLVARLAEWQFGRFDNYWPSLTVLGLAAFFSLPIIIITLLVHRRRKGEELATHAQIVLNTARHLKQAFATLTLISTAAAILCIILLLTLPPTEGRPLPVAVGGAGSIDPGEGPRTLLGYVDLRSVARYDEDLLITGRTLYFAPVRASSDDRSIARYFVEVHYSPDGPQRFYPIMTGVLRHRGLPGEIASLYRGARFPVADDNYLLYRSGYQLRWRYYVLAAEFGIGGVLLGIVTLILRRRARVFAQQLAGEETRLAAP